MDTDNRKKYKILAKQSILTFLTYALRFVFRFLKTAIISRLLGPTYRGALSLVMLIPSLIVMFGNIGFGQAIIYYVAKKNYDYRKVLGSSLLFGSFCSALLICLSWVVLHIPIIFGKSSEYISDQRFLIVSILPFMLLHHIGRQFLIAKGHLVAFNMVGISDSVVPIIMFFTLWFIGINPYKAALLSWFFSYIFISLIPYSIAFKSAAFPLEIDISFFKKAISYGFYSHLANVFQFFLLRIDFIFISSLLGATDLGYYAVATTIAEILFVLTESIAVPFVPILFGSTRKEGDQLTPVVLKVSLILLICACAGTAVFGKTVIKIAFGKVFLPAYYPLLCLFPGIICMGLFPFFKADLFSRRMHGIVSVFSAVAIVLNFILNTILIPTYGIVGAAISSSLSYALLFGLTLAYYAKLTNHSFKYTFFFNQHELTAIKSVITSWVRRD